MTRDKFTDIAQKYTGGIEPLDNWDTEDVVKMIDLLDAELQRREYEKAFPPFYDIV